MIAIVDYGVGNLRSVQKALERVGAEAVVTGEPGELARARAVVLPGVGAFGDGVAQLWARGLFQPVLHQVEAGKPLLGICLGMQLLFEESEEMGQHRGLGLLPGRVVRFPEGDLKVPHIGWNQLRVSEDPLLAGIKDGSYAYFVHSYYVAPAQPGDVLATTEYGVQFAAVVGRGQVWGAQFHPEKSQEVGLRLLQNFARLVGEL
jgi:imidazole glycerol-phosphate synthase subunit HisH